ncbi:hypothetical protein VTI74DRAFT_8136 [Chaetomium olivicolor]
MAYRANLGVGTPAPHACPHCPKSFARLCDLNKHAKSHSRPYKCNEPGCKYGTLGWPTAKELERHHNDKHSASPRIYHCLFPPCPYWSKRESNCKQHMEKAHDWVYVRSKSKGSRSAFQFRAIGEEYAPKDSGMAVDAHGGSGLSSSPQSLVPPPNADFILFDNDGADAVGEDDDHPYPGYGEAQGTESYLPWTSPMTRLRKNEQFIEMFSQTYHGAQDRMCSVGGTSDSEADAMFSSPVQHEVRGFPPADGHDRSYAGEIAVKVESPIMTVDATPPRKKYEPFEVSPGESNKATFPNPHGQSSSNTVQAGAGQAAPTPSKARLSSKSRDSGGEGSFRPKKRLRPSPPEDFTDTSMPDIFRHAHPHIYDRSRTERYSPCHTLHRDISTLVRHLSRPAHRLKVTDRAISSFDIENPVFRHPRVGVCRSCWRTFSDRQAFDAHISHPCERVSKGKREKWRVLYESFTPLVDPADHALSGVDSSQHSEEQWQTFSEHLDTVDHEDEAPDHIRTPSTSVPSPMLFESAEFGPLDPGNRPFVPADEHHRLQQEHQALQQQHQQLERMTRALLVRQLVQETMRQTTATPDVKLPAVDSPKSNSSAIRLSDRESLCQHMNSRSTDVDVHAFVAEMENTHRSLSRMNSGLSTASQSTIHRVPPSPPPRSAGLPGEANGGGATQQGKHSLAHRAPLPSIPDSGYGTEHRRCSLFDLPTDAVQQAAERPLTPRSSREQPEDMKPTIDGLPWGDSPSQRMPRVNILSPHNSQQQPGFLMDHDMADYDDYSYNIFYQGDNIHRRSSPTGFTFD